MQFDQESYCSRFHDSSRGGENAIDLARISNLVMLSAKNAALPFGKESNEHYMIGQMGQCVQQALLPLVPGHYHYSEAVAFRNRYLEAHLPRGIRLDTTSRMHPCTPFLISEVVAKLNSLWTVCQASDITRFAFQAIYNQLYFLAGLDKDVSSGEQTDITSHHDVMSTMACCNAIFKMASSDPWLREEFEDELRRMWELSKYELQKIYPLHSTMIRELQAGTSNEMIPTAYLAHLAFLASLEDTPPIAQLLIDKPGPNSMNTHGCLDERSDFDSFFKRYRAINKWPIGCKWEVENITAPQYTEEAWRRAKAMNPRMRTVPN